ncbi:MAG: hypothetical protein JRE18_04740 [Deltaproteobacteria bacterium]|nr:hypothetical protein [Deltaproteobacteria bacterium]
MKRKGLIFININNLKKRHLGRLQTTKQEAMDMKSIIRMLAKTAALIALLGLIMTGCAPQTGTAVRQYDENWRFVPSIHIEDNPFTNSMEYRDCIYDQLYAGYWCPVDR